MELDTPRSSACRPRRSIARYAERVAFTRTVSLTVGDATYELTLAEQQACDAGAGWHGPGDPSTGLTVAVFQAARQKYPGLDAGTAEELAALALGLPRAKVTELIDWHIGYMRMHDGDYSYDVR